MLIATSEVNAWLEKTKINLTSLDSDLAGSITELVLGEISSVVDPAAWVDTATTPSLIRKIIAMRYAGWYYQRVYSEDEETNSYGLLLLGEAERLTASIVNGILKVPGALAAENSITAIGRPSFYPNDLSSNTSPTSEDSSTGPAKFTMGHIW